MSHAAFSTKKRIDSLSAEQAIQLIQMVVGTILYLTTTCVLWWFGTRNKGAPPKVE